MPSGSVDSLSISGDCERFTQPLGQSTEKSHGNHGADAVCELELISGSQCNRCGSEGYSSVCQVPDAQERDQR